MNASDIDNVHTEYTEPHTEWEIVHVLVPMV
jgi:hypothetical protein